MATGDLLWPLKIVRTKTKNAFFEKYIKRLFLMKNQQKTCNQNRELLNIIKIDNQEPEL